MSDMHHKVYKSLIDAKKYIKMKTEQLEEEGKKLSDNGIKECEKIIQEKEKEMREAVK